MKIEIVGVDSKRTGIKLRAGKEIRNSFFKSRIIYIFKERLFNALLLAITQIIK